MLALLPLRGKQARDRSKTEGEIECEIIRQDRKPRRLAALSAAKIEASTDLKVQVALLPNIKTVSTSISQPNALLPSFFATKGQTSKQEIERHLLRKRTNTSGVSTFVCASLPFYITKGYIERLEANHR
jgi:hypothetical protein